MTAPFTALKSIHRAIDVKTAKEALTAFEVSEWGRRDPSIRQSWRRLRSEIIRAGDEAVQSGLVAGEMSVLRHYRGKEGRGAFVSWLNHLACS